MVHLMAMDIDAGFTEEIIISICTVTFVSRLCSFTRLIQVFYSDGTKTYWPRAYCQLGLK